MESLPKLMCYRADAVGSRRRWELVKGRLRCKRVVLLGDICSQAKEGMWGMPGHTEAMKAVVSCEKLRGVAHTR
jgi:hypothetical protein